jgi:hypothetical protein
MPETENFVYFPCCLTEESPRATPPETHFRGTLMLPQQVLLRAMLDWEAGERPPSIEAHSDYLGSEGVLLTVDAPFGVVKERPSFGKTVLALALVCASPTPPRPRAPVGASNEKTLTLFETAHWCSVTAARQLELTIVLAASGVVQQWADNAAQFTALRVRVVSNVFELRAFERDYHAGELACDLLIVKAGTYSSANYKIEGEPVVLLKKQTRPIIGALALILEGVEVARVIVDDYDIHVIEQHGLLPLARFTWYMSATAYGVGRKNVAVWRPSDAALVRRAVCTPPAAEVAPLVVQTSPVCDQDFVTEHLNMFAVDFRRVRIADTAEVRILNALGVEPEVIEMLCAGAANTAAERLGVGHSTNLVDHFVRAGLGAAAAADRAAARLQNSQFGASSNMQLITNGDVLRASNEQWTADQTRVCVASDKTSDLAALAEARRVRASAIERMRANAREGDCQCCTLPLEGAANIALGCCQIAICDDCVAEARETKRCPACTSKNFAPLPCSGDIPAEHGDIDKGAADLQKHLGWETSDWLVTPQPRQAGEAAPRPGDLSRLAALVHVLQGRECEASEPIEGLVAGVRSARRPIGTPVRAVVYAGYDESLSAIEKALTKAGIAFRTLRGTCKARAAAVAAVRDGEAAVLLVATPENCAGLHMPFLTHVIFYHVVFNKNVCVQVASRGARVGREFNLEVVTIMSASEFEKTQRA